MTDFEQHRTFLNINMNPLWKGIVLSLITLLLAYPLIQLEFHLFLPKDSLDRYLTIWWLSVLYWIFLPIIWIIALYAGVSVFNEKKTYFLPAFILSIGTICITLLY